MAFLRGFLSVLVASIAAGMVAGGTTASNAPEPGKATNVLNVPGSGSGSPKVNALAASLASNPGDLTDACRRALLTLAGDETLSTCANLFALDEIRHSKKSISGPIKTWIEGMCKASPCDTASLTKASKLFQSSCETQKSVNGAAFYSILSNLAAIRTDACKNTSKLDFCEPSLAGHRKKWEKQGRPFFSVSKEAYCLECGEKSASQPPADGQAGKKPSPKQSVCSAPADPKQKSAPADKAIVVSLPSLPSSTKPANQSK
ncbi:hypothetical protein PCANC_16106 [Puccinia coronata f. sp. avenae]|uniref:Uncharacterized protein n=1 Tax=Puccinia coronata f. sp. avenae TaxID=200324 RepID=A0A2N5SF66_9BASI|nr:hypothetical protein PCANC_22254 [Puccinia coronata f. sp. avenae]PLW36047.1 hypothetical protein PCANC_16106 [Puccinia coronata f. sp. avenae]